MKMCALSRDERMMKNYYFLGTNSRERSASPPAQRSTLEGVKSFSIDHILGHANNNNSTETNQQTNSKIVRPWDQFSSSVHAVRPFLPPALFHYEHRFAMDYHRHLEQLSSITARAQLLRHMNMNMAMDLKSESGSERSSSAASDCCSPEISSGSRLSDHHIQHQQQSQQSSQSSHHHNNSQSHSQKTKPNGTPLDALFQMTNKNFDESQGRRL